jgi:hypothetical protein
MSGHDSIVDEIRRIRQEHTDRFNGDLHAICEDLRRQERESGRRYVSFPPRRVRPVGASKPSDENEGTTGSYWSSPSVG